MLGCRTVRLRDSAARRRREHPLDGGLAGRWTLRPGRVLLVGDESAGHRDLNASLTSGGYHVRHRRTAAPTRCSSPPDSQPDAIIVAYRACLAAPGQRRRCTRCAAMSAPGACRMLVQRRQPKCSARWPFRQLAGGGGWWLQRAHPRPGAPSIGCAVDWFAPSARSIARKSRAARLSAVLDISRAASSSASDLPGEGCCASSCASSARPCAPAAAPVLLWPEKSGEVVIAATTGGAGDGARCASTSLATRSWRWRSPAARR